MTRDRAWTAAWVFALALATTQCSGQSLQIAAAESKAGELLKELDDDRYDRRRRAAEQLAELAKNPAVAAWLSSQCQRRLRDPSTSFEVRVQLELLAKRLPPASADSPIEPGDDEIARLFALLESPSYATRLGAEQRLVWLANDAGRAMTILGMLGPRLADESLSADSRSRLLTLDDQARGAWLASDPKTWRLPPVTDDQIERTIDDLVRSADDHRRSTAARQFAASRRMLDVLARDECVPRIVKLLESRLQNPQLTPAAADRLTEFLDWTRPALVAEIWQFQQHVTIQHLWVDVPRQSAGATRPSHFDRIDDATAHCVSGQNLTPGDYPVGLAIAHPENENWMCHIQNLPTPRRRMLYDYAAKTEPAVRLRAITERTLQAATRERRLLTDLQIKLFAELDTPTVGRLIGPYLKAVDDREVKSGPHTPGGENASHHARICAQLAEMGTKEAGPGLIEALAANRFLPAGDETDPYVWSWIAPLAIAQRDPWPGADEWLASLIERKELLYAGEPIEEEPTEETEQALKLPRNIKSGVIPPPELGATAAALLLTIHGAEPSAYGIETVAYDVFLEFELQPCRFTSAKGSQAVLRWWEAERGRSESKQAP